MTVEEGRAQPVALAADIVVPAPVLCGTLTAGIVDPHLRELARELVPVPSADLFDPGA